MSERTSSSRGALYVILSAILFGMMPLWTKTAYAYGCNAYMVGAGRFFFGALGTAAVIAVSPGLSFRVTAAELRRVFLLSLPFCATTILLYSSYRFISSGLATTLHFTYPVTVMMLGALAFHIRLRRRQIVCLLICAAGILCFYRPGQSEGPQGMTLALLSGVTYAVYILVLGKSRFQRLPVLAITFWLSCFSFAEMMLFSGVTGKLAVPAAWPAWLALAGLGLSASLAAVALFQKGVFLCGEVKASLLSTFEPLTSVVIGVAAFHEGLTLRVAVGVLLILISAVLLVLSPKKEREKAD